MRIISVNFTPGPKYAEDNHYTCLRQPIQHARVNPQIHSPHHAGDAALDALAAQAFGVDQRCKTRLHYDRHFPYLSTIGSFTGAPSLSTFALAEYPAKSLRAHWLELVQLETSSAQRKTPDLKKVAEWLAQYPSSKAKVLVGRLKRLLKSSKPLYKLVRKEKGGGLEKLRQHLEGEQPLQVTKTRPLSDKDRELILAHKKATEACKRKRGRGEEIEAEVDMLQAQLAASEKTAESARLDAIAAAQSAQHEAAHQVEQIQKVAEAARLDAIAQVQGTQAPAAHQVEQIQKVTEAARLDAIAQLACTQATAAHQTELIKGTASMELARSKARQRLHLSNSVSKLQAVDSMGQKSVEAGNKRLVNQQERLIQEQQVLKKQRDDSQSELEKNTQMFKQAMKPTVRAASNKLNLTESRAKEMVACIQDKSKSI